MGILRILKKKVVFSLPLGAIVFAGLAFLGVLTFLGIQELRALQVPEGLYYLYGYYALDPGPPPYPGSVFSSYWEAPLEPTQGFNTQANHPILIQWGDRLANGYALERIVSTSTYPQVIVFLNFDGEEYFLVAGRANPFRQVIGVSELLIFPGEEDDREVLAVLAHEVGHLQHPAFFTDLGELLGAPEDWDETLTQIASLEVLAGQCNAGWELACGAFRKELQTWYRVAFIKWAWDRFGPIGRDGARLLLGLDLRKHQKWDRFWAPDMGSRLKVWEKYSIRPLMILMGFRGCRNTTFTDVYTELTFDLDDLCAYIP